MTHVKTTVSALASAAVVAAIGLGAPAAQAATGDIAEFNIPDASSAPIAITPDADGTLWIAQSGSVVLSKSTLAGNISVVMKGGGTNPGPPCLQRLWGSHLGRDGEDPAFLSGARCQRAGGFEQGPARQDQAQRSTRPGVREQCRADQNIGVDDKTSIARCHRGCHRAAPA